MTKYIIVLALSGLGLSGAAFADWTLVAEGSRLNFLSIKKGTAVESHHFQNLSGTVTDTGAAQIAVDLASVETNIDIRNERMQAMLFDVPAFPSALISANIDVAILAGLADGQRVTQKLSLELDLHGIRSILETEVYITGLGGGKVAVATVKPVILSADDFGLGAGIEALREIAKLPAITHSVPVTFNLLFGKS